MPVRSFFLDHLWLKTFSLVLAMLIWITIRSSVEREAHEEAKTFEHEPVALLADPSERRTFVVDPANVSITVKGAKPVIDSLKDIRAYVELSSHAGNDGNYRVEVHVPAGVALMLVHPKTVFVRGVSP